MVEEVILDHMTISVTNYKEDIVNNASGKESKQISFEFKVRGRQDYHDITVLLYNTTFDVSVPGKSLKFRGTINHYSTSVPNFEDEHSAVDFKLGLIEV
ncbi:DUF3219 family protein [Paenibacillus abyssi]|uniref:DUF3219 domain-containing protein n=1 Tax=Paenibacillus abyssi TaxID=1340531 RepID=A0A917FMI5_9BACL|nr:DUF3219 family protein [Paenibacillus abyssi]GGF89435.1 hypothetical protein GCM10010916_03470 [Paenibacillus abyssi]